VKLTPARLRRLLTKAGRRRDLDRDIERLRQVFTDTYLHQPARIENAMGIQLSALLRQFDAACVAAEELAEAASAHFEQHPDAAIITSFPGLGNLTGARVLAEIGDDARFADALCPYHPRQRQENRCAASAYQKPAAGRRRPDLGADVAARLARRPTTLRARRTAGDWNHQAQRHLFNKFLGQLHHCLQTGQPYNEHLAFPPPLELAAWLLTS
jgi:transposase